jgi:rod shape determining protein RodA
MTMEKLLSILKINKINFKNMDYLMLFTTFLLSGIGLYCVRQSELLSEEKNGLFTKQLFGVALGMIIIITLMLIDYRFLCKLSYIMYVSILLILALTLKFGNNVNNVKRWITIGGIPFQPSELTKVVLILFLSYLCSVFKDKLDKLYIFMILAAVAALPTILILLEPHLSSCVSIFFIFCIIIYASGMKYRVIGKMLVLVVPVIAGIVISAAVFHVKIPFVKDYMINRILIFQSSDEEEDTAGKFQQNQSIAAIGSGGLAGKMLSENEDARIYRHIYANESDFVFSIIGEDFGFIGSTAIVALYFVLILRCLVNAAHAPDYLGRIICIGVSALLIFQTIANIGVATNFLPNTGLTLPFISYGLTSLISSMTAVGLVIGIRLRASNIR